MKKFRRISTLALVLVLVCLCTVSVFAATANRTDYCGNIPVVFDVAAEDYFARSTITVEKNDISVSGYVQVTAYYYKNRTDAGTTTITQTQNTTGNGATKTISFNEDDIFIVSKAVGLYKVTINSTYFAPSSLTATHYTK